jgi:transposase-like protein
MTQLMRLSKTLIIPVSTAALLYGCSGHTLQDWADEAFNQKGSATPQTVEAGASEKEKQVDETRKPTENTAAPAHEVTKRNNSVDATDTASTDTVSPSENSALQSISPSPTASGANDEHRLLQQKTNTWIEEEWTPRVETNETIKEQNEDVDRPFTLQEYVDKAGVYLQEKEKEQPNMPSHKEQMDELPVIGK